MAAAKHLTAQEERALIKKAQRGDLVARNTLVERHYGFIWSQAIKFAKKHPQFSPEDLLGEASLGYINCIEKFDLDRGLRLNTYAGRVIANYLNRFAWVDQYVIRVPAPARYGAGTEQTRADANRALNCVLSMHAPVSAQTFFGDGQGFLGDLFAKSEVPTLAYMIVNREPNEPDEPCLGDLLDPLPPKLRHVIERKLRGQSDLEIGASLGVTKQRVGQLRASAMQIMREVAAVFRCRNRIQETPQSRSRSMYLAVLRILLAHSKDLPAIIAAVEELRKADGIYDGWEQIKHLGDLLVPIAVEIQSELGEKGVFFEEAFAAPEATPEDLALCAKLGIDWDALIAALPQIIAVVKTILSLLQK